MANNITISIKLDGGAQTVDTLSQVKNLVDSLKNTNLNINIGNVVSNTNRMLDSFSKIGKTISDSTVGLKNFRDTFVLDGQGLIAQWDNIGKAFTDSSLGDVFVKEGVNFKEFASTASEAIGQITAVASSGLNAISGFSTGIADAFSGMASMFQTDFMSVAYRTVAHQITSGFMSAIPSIIQRYDIMSTFTDYMNLAGVDTETANAALSRVDQSIRGIPIGLDEAAFRLRRYQMYLGDIDRATNLTIGVQNALMAGGASEQMRNTAYTQIDRLLATGKLSQARQWMSLFNGLGVSLRFLKEELALDPTASMQQVAADLASGAIATDDFLHAMERLADNEGLTQALTIYKGTVEAWLANIKNAIKRGGQAIMEAMDDVMTDQFGQGITGVLKIIRDQIDSISQAGANFIRQNPELVGTLGEIFGGIWERIQSVDFGSFIGKLVDNLGRLAEIIFRIFDNLPDGFLSDFVSFAVTLAGPLSLIFKAVSSGLPLIIGVFERMKDMDFADLIEKIVRQVELFAKVIERVLSIIPDGLLGDLMAFGLVWGKPLVGIINGISGALTNLFNGIGGMGGQGLFGGLGGLIRNLGQLMGYPMLGVVSGLAAGIGIIVYETREYYRELEKIAELNFDKLNPDFDTLVADTEAMVSNMKRTREGWETSVQTIENQAEIAHDLVEEIGRVDEQIGDTDDLRERNRLIAEQEGLIARLGKVSDITLTLDSETGLLNDESRAVMDLADSYIELAKAKAIAEAYESNIGEAYTGLIEAQAQRSQLVEERRRYRRQLNQYRMDMDIARNKSDRPNTDLSAAGQAAFEAEGEAIAEDFMTAQANYDETAANIAKTDEEIKKLDEQIAGFNQQIEFFGVGLTDVLDEINRLSAIDFTPIEGGRSFNNLDENIKTSIASFNALEDSAREAVHGIGSGFEKMETASAQAASTTTANLKTITDFFTSYNDNLKKILRFDAENEDYDFGTLYSRLGEINQEDAAPIIAGIAQAIDEAVQSGDYSILDSLLSESELAEAGEQLGGKLLQTMMAAANDPELLATIRENSEFFTDGETGFIDAIFGEGFEESARTAAEEAIQPVNEELETTAENAFDAKIQVGNFASTLDARMGVVSNFASRMSQVAATLAMIMANARGAAREINNLPTSKTIKINYQTSSPLAPFWERSWVNTQNSDRSATGGLVDGVPINGKMVTWTPNGTDTLPYMLTPGEYVVNRNAVNMFGQTFLEAVNGMDVGAAYDAMMARVSVPHGSTYNYYDNHATVNQNFYGNTGQGFSQKKAFKFVSAL